ncbi:MAG: ribosome maturation factor RimM [Defluviitaleaceae bacterium]|nr:ribosome maturation factor RimM [Defluviitaleaceae bacterium]
MDDFFRIGIITNTHALKGELKVLPTTDDPSRFDDMPNITVTRNEASTSTTVYDIEYVRHQKGMVVLKLTGIDDINDAEKLKGCQIIVSREDALPLEDGEYYRSDLLGMRVITDESEELGTLSDIYDTGANDVYSVTPPEGKPILIPAIKQCILNVDTENKLMTVHLLKGLR